MQIQVIATAIETKPTTKGSYQQLEVTFKNLTFNKTESKKIMSFGAGAAAFKTLADAASGQTYEVTVVKNAQGYNDWVSVTPTSTGGAPAPQAYAPNQPNKPAATTPARSTYETPEERAQRQILIVRQSSLSSAIATLTVGAKAVKPDDVIELAKAYENYVFNVKDPGPSGFEDIPDFDVPTVE